MDNTAQPPKSKAPLACRMIRFLNSSHAKSYKLTFGEEMLLISIANHDGFTGCHPTITVLMEERTMERRNMRTMIKRLARKGILVIEKKGRNNHYNFPILDFYHVR